MLRTRSTYLALLALPLAAALGSAPALAQEKAPAVDAKPADLVSTLEPIRAKHGVPAMAGVILVGDRITAIGATGLRANGSEEKVTVDDLWHLGSCTKPMTATLIARLVERGKLSWDLTLAKGLPKVKKMDPGFRPVTLELLLGNRGGAPAKLVGTPLWARLQARSGTPRKQRRLLVESVLTKPPEGVPGTRYSYSNAGFAIAGAVAERKLNAAWEDLLTKEVFDKLGMTTGGFGAPGTKKTLDQPRGHGENGITVPPGPFADNPPGIGPAATVHCSIVDWAKFVSVHLTGAKSDGSYLKPETFTKLHTPLEGQDYALGWVTMNRTWGGGRVLMHNGSNTMWYCVTWIAPAKNFAVLITCNQGGAAARTACDEVANALIQHHGRTTDEKR